MSSVSKVACFINGEERLEDNVFEKFNPATGEVAALVVESSQSLVDEAVMAARAALKGPWGKATLEHRVDALRRLAVLMQSRFSEIVAEEILDTGKPIAAVATNEINRAIANLNSFADIALSERIEPFRTEMANGASAINETVRTPVGVIGIVAPWNLPLLLLTFKVAPALACGNTIVVKPSEQTPRTAVLLAKLALEAGIPAGVINVVHGHGANAAGSFLTAHPGIDAISFTGETKTGEAIMRSASVGPRAVSMELGGKNPALIFSDCDFDAAVTGTVRSMFDNAGQVCLTTERLYVQRPIFDRFVEALAEKALALKPGDPMDPSTTMGPSISAEQQAKVLGFYERTARGGATVITGGGRFEMPAPFTNGYWVQPTIWTGLGDDAEICRNEVFGPCAHVAVFDDEDEVIERANNSEYGLAATIWTKDSDKASRVARQLENGTVWINCWRVRDERAAFGGFKKSGVGREGGSWSLNFYSHPKTICRLDG
ncbi:2-hydroxymuconic semialdehyde dehydrogenase [Nitratireductor aestuarii]|uniref:2-hydroxymuconic semialdehyde dehydrogenase n=1 Tax=Nitratireductor aestuarii TaxID=1735103 RepID=A0A916RJP2_9HYPH|nr:aldehyde dehydrogenase family protein [Nitratireductor aestuarii]GGA59190.1 2-hydroxymuconic semialdehyde dehydrogenase [Nitratireductor aestuarii]